MVYTRISKDCFTFFSLMFFLVFLGFLVVFEFRKVREGAGIHFHQVSSKSDSGRPSYDPKTEVATLRRLIIVPGGANNESPGWSWWSWYWFL